MSDRIGRRTLAVLLAAGVLAAPACGSSSGGGSTSATGSAELCGNIAKMQTSVAAVQKLDPSTVSANQMTAALGAIRDSWSHIQGSMSGAPDEVQSEMARAFGGFRTSLQAQDPQAAPGDVLQGIQPDLEHMSTALTSAGSDLSCT